MTSKRKFKPHDHPYDECLAGAQRVMERGGTIFQKWWCAGCGARCSAYTPNEMRKLCLCEHCGTMTDITEHGCNYAAILTLGPR